MAKYVNSDPLLEWVARGLDKPGASHARALPRLSD
jgi:hypothetical protein